MREIKENVENIKQRISKIRVYLDLPHRLKKKEELEAQTREPEFWKDNERAKRVQAEIKTVNNDKKTADEIQKQFEEVEVTLELANEDDSLENELKEKYKVLLKYLEKVEFKLLLNEPFDRNNAIVTIHSGAGGTEACDWVSMLFRMYSMWCEKKGFGINVTDELPGEEAGIKNITFEVFGDFAFGYFKAEKGVHRLVRISPFDSNKRRHTSFASLEVVPEIDESINIDIKDEDLRIDTYRASGAGGQHVNTTDSAVRITHVPTNVIVTCQNERSQIKNRATAMKILKARLFAREEEIKREAAEKAAGDKKTIGWGSQIRSYVFHPYKMIKDLRTGYERGDVDKVMGGDLDRYVEEFLKLKAEENAKN
ncbi:MAG: peptide chain release factor 2 [Candidatus Goldiibacteriota bacterium]